MDYGLMKMNSTLQCNYTGTVDKLVLIPGTYEINVYGAGGGNDSNRGGYGGYAGGKLTVYKTIPIFIRVGGAGASAATGSGGGFNGGGNAGRTGSSGGGGGASDIRVKTNSLYSRIIVAGGGGGGGNSYATRIGGNGGRPNGERPNGAGIAGTLSGGYSFGQGGHHRRDGGGGGGGWYGGYPSNGDGGGSGGSSYVWCEEFARYYPSGCLLSSDMYFTEYSFNPPAALSANTRHGYIVIKYLENVFLRKNTNIYDNATQETSCIETILEGLMI